jgi:hypothetical protein
MKIKSTARNYTRKTEKLLFNLASNECAHPDCTKPLLAEDGNTLIGIIAHIEAASENGPRYNAEMTNDERRGFANLMVLCDEHHKVIDNKENESVYPKELLISWKSNHEAKAKQRILKNPSLLFDAVNQILKLEFVEETETLSAQTKYRIDDKISYNNVKRYRIFIDEYKIYYGKLDKIYQEMDRFGPKKDKLFRIIKHIYLGVKKEYVDRGDYGEEKLYMSDDIMDEVEGIFLSKLTNNIIGDYDQDEMQLAVIILMVDAFIRCKILEEPPSNYANSKRQLTQ